MKKLMYVGLALMLSFALCGLSVAEDGLKTENLTVAADNGFTQGKSAFGESNEWPDGILLAAAGGQPCTPFWINACIGAGCCDGSPYGNDCTPYWQPICLECCP